MEKQHHSLTLLRKALDFYGIFTNIMGWKNWGTILGGGKEDEARELGAAIR